MNCCSMIQKMIHDKFFYKEPELPIYKAREKKESSVVKVEERKTRRKDKKSYDEDDLFKEMTPSYIAPKRIGATMLVKQEKVTNRFDMELDHESSWHVDEGVN